MYVCTLLIPNVLSIVVGGSNVTLWPLLYTLELIRTNANRIIGNVTGPGRTFQIEFYNYYNEIIYLVIMRLD